MEKEQEVAITVYDVVFKGVFGRNRSVKVEVPFRRETPPCFDPVPEFYTKLMDEAAAKIKPKQGVMFVRKTEGCKRSTFDMGDGRTGSSLTFPLYQAQRVARRDYAGGVGVDATPAAVA